MVGINFQPGGTYGGGQQRRSDGSAVQEAIKVLSLRLPRVVGAQAISPQGLLRSQGSQGNRVDSVVNNILNRMFPGAGGMTSPSFGTAPEQMGGGEPMGNAPSFSGGYGGPMAQTFQQPLNPYPVIGTWPNIQFGEKPPAERPYTPETDGGDQPAPIAPASPWPQFQSYQPPGNDRPYEI